MLEKEKVGVIVFFSVPQILHATNLMKAWDWKFKQKYLLIRNDNAVVTFANQKLKFDVSKI